MPRPSNYFELDQTDSFSLEPALICFHATGARRDPSATSPPTIAPEVGSKIVAVPYPLKNPAEILFENASSPRFKYLILECSTNPDWTIIANAEVPRTSGAIERSVVNDAPSMTVRTRAVTTIPKNVPRNDAQNKNTPLSG